MGIFKDYDIRGIYPEELNEENAFLIGRALGAYLKGRPAFLNYDTRVGSVNIKDDVVNGILKSGSDVYELGCGPITVSNFASFNEKACGVSITASHNPAAYTGVIMYVNGTTLTPASIKTYYASKTFVRGAGRRIPHDYDDEYTEYITRGIRNAGINVGFDGMGGATTYITPHVLEKIGAKVCSIRPKATSDFYGRTPEPSKANSAGLSHSVRKNRLDFGAQLDADGDRVVFVDDLGRFLDLMVTAMVFIKHLKLKKVTASIACSRILERYADVVYVKVGRPYIEDALKKAKSDFGVETSSHFYFADYYPFSDGILATVLMAKLLAKSGKRLSAIVDGLPKVYYGTDALNFSDDAGREAAMERIIAMFKGYKDKIELDGVKAVFEDGFVLFRKSNTEPIIRAYYDGDNPAGFRRMRGVVEKMRAACGD